MSEPRQPIILCPLALEYNAMQRLFSARCEIHCTGPGSKAIEAWFAAYNPTGRTILLAGVAGALTETRAAGTAWLVTKLCCESQEYSCPLALQQPLKDLPCAVGTSTSSAVTSAKQRQALAQATGAELVDQESETFATAATARQCNWLIVRGVSDGIGDVLPQNIDTWVGPNGRARPAAITRSLLRHPKHLATMLRLQQTTTAALGEVGELIRRLLLRIDPSDRPR